jgi:hypothetical protein
LGETLPTGLFSLLVALYYYIASAHVLLNNPPFFLVCQERDRMRRHIVCCSWRCLVTILGLQLVYIIIFNLDSLRLRDYFII